MKARCARWPASLRLRNLIIGVYGDMLARHRREWYTHVRMAPVYPLLSELLTSVGIVCRADALAVYTTESGRPCLAADWRLDQRLYDLLVSHWQQAKAQLQTGRRVALDSSATALPILGRAGQLLGVMVYVGSLPHGGARRIFLDESLSRAGLLLANPTAPVVRTEHCSTLVPFDLADDPDELERQAYEELLDRCGWHVSHIARLLHMTRQAFYVQLEKVGLSRPTRTARRHAES